MDEVTVEDADAGEVIETIMVDESVDVPISVSGEDPSGPVEGMGKFKQWKYESVFFSCSK